MIFPLTDARRDLQIVVIGIVSGVLLPAWLVADNLEVPGAYETIQLAIDAARAGDIVLVAPGTYQERVQLKPGVTLKSQGDNKKGKLGLQRAEQTIIDGSTADPEEPGVEMAENSTLDGFTVTGVGTYDEKTWKSHHETQGSEQPHSEIGAPGVAGIAIAGVGDCLVTNNIVHHVGYTGIAITGKEEKRVSPRIVRNIAYRNMGGGIGSMNGSEPIITENTCFENFYAGIGTDHASPLVMNNTCYANIRSGIGVSENSSPIVRGNKCYKNRRSGIGIRTGEGTQPLVEDNDCYRNDMSGIGVEEQAAPVIRKNRCYDNALAGIGCRGGSKPTIMGNRCYRNGQSGIGCRDGVEALVIGNECSENGKVGIGNQGDSRTTLIGNYCHHNKTAGIAYDDSEVGTSTVRNNRVIDNATVAVGIQSGWTVDFSDNVFSRKGGLQPIVMVSKGTVASFTKNTIQGEGVAAIRVAGTVTAVGNHFEAAALRKVGPPSFAIWALAGSRVTLSGNEFLSWRHALHATSATVSANNNVVRNFHGKAFVVNAPTVPPNIIGNTAFSNDSNAQVIAIEGKEGIVTENKVEPVPSP